MRNTKNRKLGRTGLASVVAGLVLGALGVAGGALAQNASPEDIATGFRIFRQKGNCQTCHGWAADGVKMDTQMPDGANLRETDMDRETILTTIRCGRPDTGMPAFERLAYSDGRCYGMKKADVDKAGMSLTDPPATLSIREIELVTDFLFAKVIGKGAMDREKCIDLFGSDVATCKQLSK